ncbi:formate/nitrite transporter family protein [Mycoplasmatota bacterium]|nr:formate/nitrite transporter family protein [Mycoplasmatota bacterium]
MLSAKEIAFETCVVGETKIKKKFAAVLVSAMLAGMYIAFGFYAYVVVNSGFSSTAYPILGRLLGSMVFPVGIVLVIIAGSELFTGNCLLALGYLDKRYRFSLILKNLGIVWVGNFLGALFFVFVLYFSRIAESSSITNTINSIAQAKVDLGFIEAMMRGILCNIAVSLAVYMSFSAKSVPGKVIVAVLPVFTFVLSGFEHSVANMFILPLSALLGSDITIPQMFQNLIPVTIGNIIGGGIIIPFSYYIIFVKTKK